MRVALLLLLFVLFADSKTVDNPVIFPGDVISRPIKDNQIPNDVLLELQNVRNISDFLNFVLGSNKDTTTDMVGRPIGNGTLSILGKKPLGGGVEQSISQDAGCKPELISVPVPRDEQDPSLLSWPRCVRLTRCGGCCSSDLLECVPTNKTTVDINVMEARYRGRQSSDFDKPSIHTYKMEKHHQCKCQCKQRAEHCNNAQVYLVKQCRCECTNRKAREACSSNKSKFWDSNDCQCKCKDTEECSTGFYFSLDTCGCELSSDRLAIRSGVPRRPTNIPPIRPTLRPVSRLARIGSIAGTSIVQDEGSESQSGRHIGIRPNDRIGGLYTMALSSSRNKDKTYVVIPPVSPTTEDD